MPSVNAAIDSDDFPTAWGTFAQTSSAILDLPPGCRAATFDISAAYRITPVRPSQQNALCVLWRGMVYVDRALMFGLASSAGVFGAVADMLVAIYEASGYRVLGKWVDDFFVVQLPHEHWSEEEFIKLTAKLGVPWSHEKTRRLSVCQRYIGFNWDLERKVVSLPKEKLNNIVQLISQWTAKGARFTMTEAAHLHGKLVHVATIFPLIRPFIRSTGRFASSFSSHRARLGSGSSLRADLCWINSLLLQLPNEIPLQRPDPLDIGWWGDASSSFGIGVTVGPYWGAWTWAPGMLVGPHQAHDIGWAEAVAVELGLRMAVYHGLVQSRPQHHPCLLVRSDNTGVVHAVNGGRSRSVNTNEVLKHVYALCASHAVHLCATYVASRDNITDALSRGDVAAFLAGSPQAVSRTSLPLPEHLTGKLTSW